MSVGKITEIPVHEVWLSRQLCYAIVTLLCDCFVVMLFLANVLQMVQTPQGLVSAHQPVFNVVQGTLATGAGAAGAGGLVGGVPFHQYHHHQVLAAAASTGQPGVGVATQPLTGAAGQR